MNEAEKNRWVFPVLVSLTASFATSTFLEFYAQEVVKRKTKVGFRVVYVYQNELLQSGDGHVYRRQPACSCFVGGVRVPFGNP